MNKLSPSQLLSEAELESLGVFQDRGWEHYSILRPEPNILLFRRPMGTDPVTGTVDPARQRMAEAAFRQQLINQNRS
ncbi:conserved unknown protein [Ectocarpus siliculosus]|uniref:Cyclin-dependent kinases regulatory subunit n=1 Tax=Ectocarpus siliculosus TaxID=2880 RepID=D8LR79_ECTSI|nr:conserved unknown protein [Ectocarpus siliculosus]|eukprot:CBN77752.1 conserved unknown protein [Ectocarpus siliculosus]